MLTLGWERLVVNLEAEWRDVPGDVRHDGVALARLVLGLSMLMTNSIPDLGWLADHPRALIDPPPGVPTLLAGMTTAPTVVLFEALLVAFVLLFTAGVGGRHISLAMGVTGILVSGLSFVPGKIDHTIMIWVVPTVFGLCGVDWRSADRVEDGQDQQRRIAGAVFHSVWLLGIAYGTAALPKLLRGWLAPDTQASYGHLLLTSQNGSRSGPLTDLAVGVSWRWVWELADWATIVLELGVILLVLRPRWLRPGLGVLAVFHLVNILILGIGFDSLPPVYLALLLPFVDLSWSRGVLEQVATASLALGIPLGVISILDRGIARWLASLFGIRPAVGGHVVVAILCLSVIVVAILGRSARGSRPGVVH